MFKKEDLKELTKKISNLFLETFYSLPKNEYNSNYQKIILGFDPHLQKKYEVEAKKFERIFYILKTNVKKEKIRKATSTNVPKLFQDSFNLFIYTELGIRKYVTESVDRLLNNLELLNKVITFLMSSSDFFKDIDLELFLQKFNDILEDYDLIIEKNKNKYYLFDLNEEIIDIPNFFNTNSYLNILRDLNFYLKNKKYQDVIVKSRVFFEKYTEKTLKNHNKEYNPKNRRKNFENLIEVITEYSSIQLDEDIIRNLNNLLSKTADIRNSYGGAHNSKNSHSDESLSILTLNTIFTCVFYIESLIKNNNQNNK